MGDLKINYVIATWSGQRRPGNNTHKTDCSLYIREQLASLKKLEHQLSQITIVVPFNPQEPAYFRKYLNSLPAQIKGVPLVVVDRINRGQSYGSYSHVYGMYRQEFDYYLLIEDDYVFVEDNFDQTMSSSFASRKNCGYLCSLAKIFDGKMHAAISNGIASSEALEKVWLAHKGSLPHGGSNARKRTKDGYHGLPQLAFSWGFLDVDLSIQDVSSNYKAPFNDVGELVFYGSRRKKNLLIPIQFKKELGYGDLIATGLL